MTQQTNVIPEGYLRNAQGYLVPTEKVADIDQARDALVKQLVAQAKDVQKTMAQFKTWAMGEVDALVELSAEKYGAKMGGNKGNITLMTYDGETKVQVAVSERLVFDERIQAAKALIDECLHEWTADSNANVKALVEHAFQTDKEGKFNVSRIISLTNLAINDEKWKQAMQAIQDSMTIASTTRYIRLYQRGKGGKYEQITLDMSAI